MYVFSLLLFISLSITIIIFDWYYRKDIFYPTIYILPQMIFLYFYNPLLLWSYDVDRFIWAAGGFEWLADLQLAATLLMLCLVVGIRIGSRSHRRTRRQSAYLLDRRWAMVLGVVFGFFGFFAWLQGIANVGGFMAAYGRAYGGGWADSGYVREAAFAGIVAVPLIMLSRQGRKMRAVDWLLVLIFISPLIVQGLLGARRGPTFLALAICAGGYFVIFRKKVSIAAGAFAGVAVGYLLLLLAANRGQIYLGGQIESLQSANTILLSWSANEYLYTSAIMRYVSFEGAFEGARITAHIAGKIIPNLAWPTVYEDLSRFFNLDIDLTLNAGVPIEHIASYAGWMVATGSAPSFVGDLILEFGYASPVAAFVIGMFYGRMWRLSRHSPSAQIVYLLMIALSIYLITQSIEAWLYRLLLYGIPAFAFIRVATRAMRRIERPIMTVPQPRTNMHHGQTQR